MTPSSAAIDKNPLSPHDMISPAAELSQRSDGPARPDAYCRRGYQESFIAWSETPLGKFINDLEDGMRVNAQQAGCFYEE